MSKILRFLIFAVIAFVCGAIAFLISNRTETAPTTFAGLYCGVVTPLTYTLGEQDFDWKTVVTGLAGGLVGGFLGGFGLSIG